MVITESYRKSKVKSYPETLFCSLITFQGVLGGGGLLSSVHMREHFFPSYAHLSCGHPFEGQNTQAL